MNQIDFEKIADALSVLAKRLCDVYDFIKEKISNYIEVRKYLDHKEQCRNGWMHKAVIKLKEYQIIQKPFIRARANL